MGYTGVVISDELFMQAITDNYSFDESLVPCAGREFRYRHPAV